MSRWLPVIVTHLAFGASAVPLSSQLVSDAVSSTYATCTRLQWQPCPDDAIYRTEMRLK